MMRRRIVSLACLSFLLLTAFASSPLSAQAPDDEPGPIQTTHDTSHPHPLDNDTIIRMVKAGLGDDLIVQTIDLQPGRYDTKPDDLITLKQSGISDRVISAMQAKGTGLAVRANARALANVSDPLTVSPVNEIGVYYKDGQGR